MKNEQMKTSFSSENFAGVQGDILQALIDANKGFAPSYGKDDMTLAAVALLKQQFGEDIAVHFTFNGTGANNFGIGCAVEGYHAVYCSDIAHLYVDESTAPETFTGCRLYPVPSFNGKLIVAELKQKIKRLGDLHHPQARVVSITQPTEYGTVYTIGEIAAIKAVCDEYNLLLHMDGARFFNAAAHLKLPLKSLSKDGGVDILTLGGTKAGMMFGEAVIFFNSDPNPPFNFHHKRSMQLASKNRFIAVQFQRLFQNNLWEAISSYTNSLARLFEKEMADIPIVSIAYPVEANMVFLTMPGAVYKAMQAYAGFYLWDAQKEEARFVFSFANTPEEIIAFAKNLRQYQ